VRLPLAAGVAAAVALALAPEAGAHLRTGLPAVDDAVRVPWPTRSVALSVAVHRADARIRLGVGLGHRVVVLGYVGEPFLRLDGRGAWVSARSPTAAAARRCVARRRCWARAPRRSR
jgi:hypothetical protein